MDKIKLLFFVVLFNINDLIFSQNNNKDEDLNKTHQSETKSNNEEKNKKEEVKKKLTKKATKKGSEEKFELNFENAALKNVLDYIEDLFNVTFLPDDATTSEDKKIRGVNDIRVTFKTNKPFTEQQVWNFLDLILSTADFSRVKMPNLGDKFYQITNVVNANKSNIPTFVGVDPSELPDYERVRYIYFISNKQVTQIRDVISRLLSKNAILDIFQELNALIFTDIGINIKALMKVVKALDSTELPEVLSVLQLKNADAADFAKLYESLKGKESELFRFGEPKKGLRFTQDTKVIAEPRRNALIIIGPKDAVQRLEKFIVENYDLSLKEQPRKIFTHKLNYVPAEQVASILNAVTQFGAESEAAKFGGIREGEKYLSKMHFAADKQGNNLIIRGEPEDYAIIKNIINTLDQKQPQVAVEVLIVGLDSSVNKSINSQIRNKDKSNLNFQTSGFFFNPPQINTTTGSIVTNLINLAVSNVPAGTTLFTLGKVDVWAILGILQQITTTNIISNPFLVITNKYSSTVSVGQTRRVAISQVVSGDVTRNEQGDIEANLTVTIQPQINSFGIINLDVEIRFDNFTQPASNNPNDITQANKEERRVHTNTNVADREVLAIGGLVRTTNATVKGGVPILSKIPIIGYLFQNKGHIYEKQNLLVFISPRIIRPHAEPIAPYTENKAGLIRETFAELDAEESLRDPINRWFFREEHTNERYGILNQMVPLKSNQTEINTTATSTNEKIFKIQEPLKCNSKSILLNSVKDCEKS